MYFTKKYFRIIGMLQKQMQIYVNKIQLYFNKLQLRYTYITIKYSYTTGIMQVWKSLVSKKLKKYKKNENNISELFLRKPKLADEADKSDN